MSKNKRKKTLTILAIITLLIIALIVIYHFTFNNSTNTSTTTNENNITNNSENQTLIAETTEQEEKWEWQHDTPENHNIDITALNSVHNTIDEYPINAEVIVKDGVIVDEYYKEGYDENSIFTLQSTSKSITSAILGIAIDNVNEYANWNEWRSSENWVNYVLDREVTSLPGTVFNYFTGNTHLLSAIIQEATGKTTYEFGKEYLFEPLDMDSVECATDAQGISDGGNGFSMNVYDMAKFGQLYLNRFCTRTLGTIYFCSARFRISCSFYKPL